MRRISSRECVICNRVRGWKKIDKYLASDGFKKCRKCKETKPTDSFEEALHSSTCLDGYFSRCQYCRSEPSLTKCSPINQRVTRNLPATKASVFWFVGYNDEILFDSDFFRLGPLCSSGHRVGSHRNSLYLFPGDKCIQCLFTETGTVRGILPGDSTFLGKPCRNNHLYRDTPFSLRGGPYFNCVACSRANHYKTSKADFDPADLFHLKHNVLFGVQLGPESEKLVAANSTGDVMF